MSEKKKPNYHIEWPEGAEIKMPPQHLEEIKNVVRLKGTKTEKQKKYDLFKQKIINELQEEYDEINISQSFGEIEKKEIREALHEFIYDIDGMTIETIRIIAE